MLSSAKSLALEGLSVHWLRPRSKAPIVADWAAVPNNSYAALKQTYRDNYNIGIRLGEPSKVGDYYCHVIDVDVKGDEDDAAEAHRYLDDILPDWRRFPYVVSGGGGHGRHIYFFTSKPYRGKKLAHSKKKVKWTDKKGNFKKSWAWEVDLFGTGRQVAAPPSIHPETGKEYVWGRKIPFSRLVEGNGGSVAVSAETVESWDRREAAEPESRSSTRESDGAASLHQIAQQKRLGLDLEEAQEYLDHLPTDEWCDDRDGWIRTGMALHHEFEGSNDGLDLWIDWSSQSGKFEEGECEKKWKGFGQDTARRPVRFATIVAAARPYMEMVERAGADTLDDLKDELKDYDWQLGLTRNEKGDVKVTSNNLALVLSNDKRFVSKEGNSLLGFNEFTEKKVIRQPPRMLKAKNERWADHMRQLKGPLWKFTPEEQIHGMVLRDDHYSDITLALEAHPRAGGWFQAKVVRNALTDAIASNSRRNTFHPIKEFLEGLEWDGKKRLDKMFVKWLGVPDTEYHRQAARIFCVAAIARIYMPGTKFDCAPVLEGAQGIGKSTFIQALAVDWFVEFKCGFDNPQRIVETLAGAWIAELPELSQFGKSDIEVIKAFFSAKSDKVRKAYRHEEDEFLRQGVYAGSSNTDDYLRDETGNRRFWPLACGVDRIDVQGFRKVVPQIWAEAFDVYHEMVQAAGGRSKIFLDLSGDAAKDDALKLQASRVGANESDLWAGMIEEWALTPVNPADPDGKLQKFSSDGDEQTLQPREFFCVQQVWVEVLQGRLNDCVRGASNKVASAIKRIEGVESLGAKRFPTYGVQKAFRINEVTRRTKAYARKLDDLL